MIRKHVLEGLDDDLDAAPLYAESMMNLRPWQLWTLDGKPAEGTLGRSFYACYNSPYTDFLVANFAANARSVCASSAKTTNTCWR